MAKSPPIETATNVRVGKYYSVPCVYWNNYRFHVPIIGPLHEDVEHINFPHAHWHIDWRFVRAYWYQSLVKYKHPVPVFAVVVCQKNTVGAVSRMNTRLKREMPEFQTAYSRDGEDKHPVPWLSSLEDAYAGSTLKPGLVCPHRGLPLAGCPVVDGAVVCPGHALKWDVTTGKLIRRVAQCVVA